MGGGGRELEFWPRIAYNLIVIRLEFEPANFSLVKDDSLKAAPAFLLGFLAVERSIVKMKIRNTLHLTWMQVGGARMFRRDYLVRLIEDMTQMIAKVFSLKQERKHTEALWELDELFKRQFRLNSELLRSLSAADIEQLFRSHGYLEADKLQSAARLMEEEASLLLELEREEEAVMLYTKVFQLYLKSALQGADLKLIGLTERIGMVRERLRSYAWTETAMRDYYAYTEQQGMYAEAENTLYQLLDNGKMEYGEAVQFYQRLQLKLPEDLAKGGASAGGSPRRNG